MNTKKKFLRYCAIRWQVGKQTYQVECIHWKTTVSCCILVTSSWNGALLTNRHCSTFFGSDFTVIIFQFTHEYLSEVPSTIKPLQSCYAETHAQLLLPLLWPLFYVPCSVPIQMPTLMFQNFCWPYRIFSSICNYIPNLQIIYFINAHLHEKSVFSFFSDFSLLTGFLEVPNYPLRANVFIPLTLRA